MHSHDFLEGYISVLEKYAALEEFAPGIPKERIVSEVPDIKKPQQVAFSIQEHDAKRAGKHYDLRLGVGNKAYSWALRHWPDVPNKKHLAVQQPDHTLEYMNFAGVIPEGYGAGKVKLKRSGTAEILEANPRTVRFNIYDKKDAEEYCMVKTQDNKWVLVNCSVAGNPKYKKDLPKTKPPYREIQPDQLREEHLSDEYAMQPKIDGAHNLFIFDRGKRIRTVSYRPRKGITGVIDHTYKVPFLAGKKTPKELNNTIIRGELWAKGPNNKSIPAATLGGLLNATTEKSRQQQKNLKASLRAVVFDVDKYKGKDYTSKSYEEKLQALREIRKSIPELEIPKTVINKKTKLELLKRIRGGEHGDTAEGAIFWPRKGGRPIKMKYRPEADVHVKKIFPAGGGMAGRMAGGFEYSLTPKGKIVGRVGTGFSHAQRKEMMENPQEFIGRVAKIKSQEQHQSGAYRAPSFKEWHLG